MKHGKRTSKLEKILRRPIALLMTVMMCASLMSVSAFAEEDVSDEIEEEPVQIAAEEDETAVPEGEETEPEAEIPDEEGAAEAEEEKEPAAEADEADAAEEADEEDALVSQSIKASIYTGSTYLIGKNDGTDITLEGKMPEGAVAKAYPVDVEIEDIEVLAAYDITILDQDGEEYQPADGAITVTIQNEAIQEAVKENNDLTVFHMEDKEAEPEKVAIKSEGRNGSVKFDAKKFSIYIVGENGNLTDENGEEVDAYTVCFYEWVYDETELGEPEVAEEKVVGDDYLNEPEVPEIEHHVFDGWFTEEQDSNHYGDGEYPGYKYDFTKTVNENLSSWEGYEVGEGKVINLYSDYDPIYYVYYMTEEQFDESGNKTNEDVVVFTDEYHENNSTLDTSNAESIYQQSHLSANQAVTSWYYYENGEQKTIASGAEITDGMELYPVVQDVIWVYFYLGEEAGENVEAVDPIYVAGDATTFGELPVPVMAGYEFAGWYFQGDSGDVLVEATSNPQEYISEEKKDIDLYAYWTPANVGYTVNIWRQKATDGQLGLDQKVVQDGEAYSTYIQYYDYAESITIDAEHSSLTTGENDLSTEDFTYTTGEGRNQQTTDYWSEWTGYGWSSSSDGTGNYVGFEYNQTRTLNDLATVTVKADGSTIVNIFYDRVTVTYNFSGGSENGTLIGLYDTNVTPTNGSEAGGTLDHWPSAGNNREWHYQTSRNDYTGMTFLAKFTLEDDNYSYRSNEVYFTTTATSGSATLYYYLEVTNPDKQLTDSSQTITSGGVTYVLDQTVSIPNGTFYFSDKYIGYEFYGSTTSANDTIDTTRTNRALNNGGRCYIFNKAITYYLDLYSNHDGEQLIESIPFKYGEDLTSYDLPTELDAEVYGPNYYYHFTGTWYEDPTFTAEFIKPESMPANNLAAYADWELNEVTVTFQSNVESDLYDQLVKCYGAENVEIISNGGDDGWSYSVVITAGDELDYTLDIGFTAAEVEGHDYEYGGLLNVDTNKVFNFASSLYTDTTLQLFWIEEQTVYHLQYHLNQGDDTTATVELGHGHESTSWAEVRELVDVFEDADDTVFICWNTEPDGSGTNFYPDDDVDFTKVAAEAVYDEETGELLYYVYNLYAIWAEEKTASLDLEYNYPEGYEAATTNEYITESNLNSIALSAYAPSNTRITVTHDDGTETVYEFAGWAYSEGATEAVISADGTVAVDNVNEEGNILYGVWLAVEPDWTVEKTLTNSGSGEDGAFKAGETATFTITVTNTGDEVIELIEVTEALDGATFVESTDGSYTLNEDKTVATITDLAAGASVEIQATYTITEDDIGEEIENSITTEGGDPDDPIPGPGDETPIPTEDANPSLSVTKTSDVAEGEVAELGQEITYTIVVTNDGNVTLTDITVTDDLTGESWTIDSLAPEASETFTTTYTVTEEDILAGSIENVATATAPNPDYDPDDPDSPENIEGEGEEEVTTEDEDPHLTVTKEATSTPENGTTYALGEEITWKVTVTNDGNLTISDIVVTDELTGDTWTVEGSLAPGESQTFETTPYTVTEDDILNGSVANVATATGTSPDPDNPETPVDPGTDEEPTDDPNGELAVTKTATSTPENGETYALGEKITYEITITNIGNLTITDIVVTDELTGDTWTVEGSLAPGESTTFETSYVVTEEDIERGDVLNEVTADGKSPDPEDPDVPGEGSDDEPTETPHPSLYVEKTANVDAGEEVVLGQEITYTIEVINNGNVTLENITVTDSITGDTWVIDKLEPNAGYIKDVTYVVTEEDILNGSIENVATATAPNPEYDPDDPDSPENIEGSDEETVTTEDVNIDWTAEKTLTNAGSGEDGKFKVGETAEFTITVTNTGNVTIEQLDVTEELEGATFKESEDGSYTLNEDKTVATITDLAVGASVELYAEYTIQEEDIGKDLMNSVSTEGGNPDDPTPGPTPEEPIPTENIDWTAEKTLTNEGTGTDGAFKVGETAEFTITVTNTGNVTIEQLDVTEELEGATFKESEDGSYTLNDDSTVATITDLVVGASVELYAEYTIQGEDLGTELVNSVSTQGGDPEDPTPGPTPEEPIPTEEEEFYDLDEEIVPGDDEEENPDSWIPEESVNEYDSIEIEMSTKLPKMSGQKMVDEGYTMTFHNKLDDGLVLHAENEFIVDINGETISTDYYTIEMADTSPLSLIQFFSAPSDECTFHVNVNLAKLYEDEKITDADLDGNSTIRVFFHVDLEDVDEENIQNVYYSTAWYDITDSEGEVIWTTADDPQYVDVYTYELIVNKYDTETGELLPDATFGIYKDSAATNAVSRNDSDYIATTDENGQAKFIGIASDTYLKELAAPDGYELNQEIMQVSTSDAENHVIEISVGNTPYSDDANQPRTPNKTSNIELGSWVAVGDEITYTIEYYNNNEEPVDVVITDTLDTGLDFVSASDGGAYDAKTRTVTWTIADAPSYETGSVTLIAKVNQTAVGNGSIQNTASVKIGDADAVDSNTYGITVATGGTTGNGGNGGNGAPKTADTNNMALWLTLLFASMAILLVGSRMRRVS